ncbi:hypothetical protein C0991_006275 [Blastosporella zonata]|nr:hypothetical protein C0991_006275 [Blastosporella zonata]
MSLAAQTFVVDDSNPRIKYVGEGWYEAGPTPFNVGNFGPPYNGTSQATHQAAASLSFQFEGTSINAFGTRGFSSLNTAHNVSNHETLNCLVDGITIGPLSVSAYPENHWLLCNKDNLGEGPHLFQINITGSGFVLDYLTFASSNESDINEFVVKLEHDNPAITYDPSWEAIDGIGSMTTFEGSQVIIDFTDGGTSVFFNHPGLPMTASTPLYNQVFFATAELPPGSHSIVVTYRGTASTPLTLEYLYVDPNQSQEYQPSSSASDAGAIAGGVIGSIVVILLAILTFIAIKRRFAHLSVVLVDEPKVEKISAPREPHRTHSSTPPRIPLMTSSNGRFKSFRASSILSDAYGYNSATIEQTRAMKKGMEAARKSQRTDYHPHDTLPLYSIT